MEEEGLVLHLRQRLSLREVLVEVAEHLPLSYSLPLIWEQRRPSLLELEEPLVCRVPREQRAEVVGWVAHRPSERPPYYPPSEVGVEWVGLYPQRHLEGEVVVVQQLLEERERQLLDKEAILARPLRRESPELSEEQGVTEPLQQLRRTVLNTEEEVVVVGPIPRLLALVEVHSTEVVVEEVEDTTLLCLL